LSFAAVKINKVVVRTVFDRPLSISEVQEKIPLSFALKYEISETNSKLVIEKEDLSCFIEDKKDYIYSLPESEEELRKADKFLLEVSEVLKRFLGIKVTRKIERGDTELETLIAYDFSELIDLEALSKICSMEVKHADLSSVSVQIDQDCSFSVRPLALTGIIPRQAHLERTLIRYVPPSVSRRIFRELEDDVSRLMQKFSKDLGLQMYKVEVRGKEYDKTLKILKGILDSFPQAKRKELRLKFEKYKREISEYWTKRFNETLKTTVPPSVRHRILMFLREGIEYPSYERPPPYLY